MLPPKKKICRQRNLSSLQKSAMNDGSEEYTFLWFIKNYSLCWHKNGEILDSPVFTANEIMGTSWWIGVYPRGESDKQIGYISLFLVRNAVDDGPEEISLDHELSVLSEDGSSLKSIETNCAFKKSIADGWPYFLGIRNVPQDILTIRCRIWRGREKVRKVAPICAQTRIAVENISFLHTIENFSSLETNKKNTLEITSNSEKGCVVSCCLYFTYDSCAEGEMIVEIRPSDSNLTLCKRKISLIGVSGHIIACGENGNQSDDPRKDIQKLPLSLTRQVILRKKSEYLPDDKLSLLCECVFSIRQEFDYMGKFQHGILTTAIKQARNLVSSENKQNTTEKASAHPSALEEIKALYVNQRLTDVKLKTKTKSFLSHKIVLCARSSVFEAMLTSDMKEKHNSCIQVDDLADDTVEQMLLFLYSDIVENLLWKTATQLYYAGDKYQIGKLREVCSSFLLENLSAANAVELLVLADTHSDSNLKNSVEYFILEHEREVFGSKDWEMLMETNPQLASKTMHLKYKI